MRFANLLFSLFACVGGERFYARLSEQEGNGQNIIEYGYYGEMWVDVTIGQSIEIDLAHNVKHSEECGNTTSATHCIYLEDTNSGDRWYPGDATGNITNLVHYFSTGFLFPNNSIQHTPQNVSTLFSTGKVTINVIYDHPQQRLISGAIYSIDDTPASYSLQNQNITASSNQLDLNGTWAATFQVVPSQRLGGGYPVRFSCAVFFPTMEDDNSPNSTVISTVEFKTSTRIAFLQNVTVTGMRAEGLFYSGSSVLSSPSLTVIVNGIEIASSPLIPYSEGNMSFIAVLQGGQVIGGNPAPTDFTQEVTFLCEYDALSNANFTEIKIRGKHQLSVDVVYDVFLGAVGVEATSEPVATIFTNETIMLNFTGTPDYVSQVQYLTPSQMSSLRNGGFYIASRAEQSNTKYYTRGQVIPLQKPKTLVAQVYSPSPTFEEPVVGIVRYRVFGPLPIAVVDGFGSTSWNDASVQIWMNSDLPGPISVLPSSNLFYSTSKVLCGVVSLGPFVDLGWSSDEAPFVVRLSNNSISIDNQHDDIGAGTLDDFTESTTVFKSAVRSQSDPSKFGFFSIEANLVEDLNTSLTSVELSWNFTHNIPNLDQPGVSCNRTHGCLNLVSKNKLGQYEIVVNLLRNRYAGPSPLSSLGFVTEADIDPSVLGIVSLQDVYQMLIDKELFIQLQVGADEFAFLGEIEADEIPFLFETRQPGVDFRLALRLSSLKYHIDIISDDGIGSQLTLPSTVETVALGANQYALSQNPLSIAPVRDLFKSTATLTHGVSTSTIETTSLRVFSYYTLPTDNLNTSIYFTLSPTPDPPEDPLSFDALYNVNKNPILRAQFDNTRSKQNQDYDPLINSTSIEYRPLKGKLTGKRKLELSSGLISLVNDTVSVIGDDPGTDLFIGLTPGVVEITAIYHSSSGSLEFTTASSGDVSGFFVDIPQMQCRCETHSFANHLFGSSVYFAAPGVGIPMSYLRAFKNGAVQYNAFISSNVISGTFDPVEVKDTVEYQCVGGYLMPFDPVNQKSKVVMKVTSGTLLSESDINQPQTEDLLLGVGRSGGFRLNSEIQLNKTTPTPAISWYLQRSISSGFSYAILNPIHLDLSSPMTCQFKPAEDAVVSQIATSDFEGAFCHLAGLVHINGGMVEFQFSSFLDEDIAPKVVPDRAVIFLGGVEGWVPDYGWFLKQQNLTADFLKETSAIANPATGTFASSEPFLDLNLQLLPWETTALRFSAFYLNVSTGITDDPPTILEVRSVSENTLFSTVWNTNTLTYDLWNQNFLINVVTGKVEATDGLSGGGGPSRVVSEYSAAVGIVFEAYCGVDLVDFLSLNKTVNIMCFRSGLARFVAKNDTTDAVIASAVVVPSLSDPQSFATSFEVDLHHGYVFPKLGPNYVAGRGFSRGVIYWGSPDRMVMSLQVTMDDDYLNLDSNIKGCPCNSTCLNIFEGIYSYPVEDNNMTVSCDDKKFDFQANFIPIATTFPDTGYLSTALQGMPMLHRVAAAVSTSRAFMGLHLNTSKIPYDAKRGVLHRPVYLDPLPPSLTNTFTFENSQQSTYQLQVSESFMSQCTDDRYSILSLFTYQPSSQLLFYNISLSTGKLECVANCVFISKVGSTIPYFLIRNFADETATSDVGSVRLTLTEYQLFLNKGFALTVGRCTSVVYPQSTWMTRGTIDIKNNIATARAGFERRQLHVDPIGQPVNTGKFELSENLIGETVIRTHHNVDHNIKCVDWHSRGCLQLRYGSYGTPEGVFAAPLTLYPQSIASPSQFTRTRLPLPVLRASEGGYLFAVYLTTLDIMVTRGQLSGYPGLAPIYTGFGQALQTVENNMIMVQSHLRVELIAGDFWMRIETVGTLDAGYTLTLHELDIIDSVTSDKRTVKLSNTGLSFIQLSLVDLHGIMTSKLDLSVSIELSNTNTRLTAPVRTTACNSPTCEYTASLLTYNTDGENAVREPCVIYRNVAECTNREACIWDQKNSTCTHVSGSAAVKLVQNSEIQYNITSSLGDKNVVVEGASCEGSASPGCVFFAHAAPNMLVPKTFFINDVTYTGNIPPVSTSLEVTSRPGKGAERYPQGSINATELGQFVFIHHWALASGRLSIIMLGTYHSITTTVMQGVLLPVDTTASYVPIFSSVWDPAQNQDDTFNFTANFYPGTGDLQTSGILRYTLSSNLIPESCIITNAKLLQPGCLLIKRSDTVVAILDYGRVDQERDIVKGEILIDAALVHVMSRQKHWGVAGVEAELVLLTQEGDVVAKRSIQIDNPLSFEVTPEEVPDIITPVEESTPIDVDTSDNSIPTWIIIVIVASVLLCLFLVLFFLYKHKTKKEPKFNSRQVRSGSFSMYGGDFSPNEHIALQTYPTEGVIDDDMNTPYEQLQSREDSSQVKVVDVIDEGGTQKDIKANGGGILQSQQSLTGGTASLSFPQQQAAVQPSGGGTYSGLPSVPTMSPSTAVNELFYPPENELAVLREELLKRENRLSAARAENQDLDSQLGYLRSDLSQRESSLAARRVENQQLTYMLSAAKQGYDISSLL